MPNRDIEEFARALVREVRDRAIRSSDSIADPDGKGDVAARWRNAAGERLASIATEMVPDCVDAAIFFLLDAVDNGLLQLSYRTESGHLIDLSQNGELAGWFIGPDGWREKYSQERLVDEFTRADRKRD